MKINNIKSSEIHSFVDGDWIESPYITNTGVRLIQTGNIGIGQFIDKNRRFISEDSFISLNCKEVRAGDILICRLADPIGRACNVPEGLGKAITSVDVIIFRPDPTKVVKDFMIYLLNDEITLRKVNDLSGGSTRQRISRTNYGQIELHLPPLHQQKKIAQILSTVDAQIEATEALIAKYEMVKEGLMQDLFTRGIDLKTGKLRPCYEDAPELYQESVLGWIPKEWEVETFSQVIELRHGYQFRDYDFIFSRGLPIVKIGQLKSDGSLDLSNCSYIDPSREKDFNAIILQKNDVLMALTGATLGKAIRFNSDLKCVQNYRVGVFKARPEKVDQSFIFHLLKQKAFLWRIFNLTNSAAQGNIGKGDFDRMLISYPKETFEQVIINRLLDSADDFLRNLDVEKNALQSLKKGLMQDLLTGKREVKV